MAPSAASRRAQPNPMPVPPPVTSACMPGQGPASSVCRASIRRHYVEPVSDLLAGDPDRFVVTFDRAGTRTPEHPTRPEIQLLSPDFYGDRFEELTSWMRPEAPLYWDDATGIWGAAAYDDVKRISREWRTFCSGQGSRPESSVPSMINMDPPEHTRRRRMISAGFTLRRVQDHEAFLRRQVGGAASTPSSSGVSATSSPTSPRRCRCT